MLQELGKVDLSERVVAFCRLLRSEGYNLGVRENLDALEVAKLSLLSPATFYHSLQSLCATNKTDWDRFDRLFRLFWLGQRGYQQVVRQRRKKQVAEKKKSIPLLMIGTQSEAQETESGKSTTGANALERLKRTDFSEVKPPDMDAMEALVLRLCQQMKLRLSRKQKASTIRAQVDLRRTIRKSLGHGGEPISLAYKSKILQKNRIVALLDVSGSMDQYSYFLLLFIHTLRRQFKALDAFAFSTRLANISRAVSTKKLKEAMQLASESAQAWSSGTRIGGCLQDFNELYGKQILQRDTIVIILSDGLDTDEPQKLVEALAYIKERVRKIVWLNPLKGMKGYTPETRAMKAALPYLDAFVAAHNVESLMMLDKSL